eukprot:764863-Hanusia_phi.AAC.1
MNRLPGTLLRWTALWRRSLLRTAAATSLFAGFPPPLHHAAYQAHATTTGSQPLFLRARLVSLRFLSRCPRALADAASSQPRSIWRMCFLPCFCGLRGSK